MIGYEFLMELITAQGGAGMAFLEEPQKLKFEVILGRNFKNLSRLKKSFFSMKLVYNEKILN